MQVETLSLSTDESLLSRVRALGGDEHSIAMELNFTVNQPLRPPLHPEVVARLDAARALGLRLLRGVPRVGMQRIQDPDNSLHLPIGEGDAAVVWAEKAHGISRMIENRGLGFARIEAIARAMTSGSDRKVWFKTLESAKDTHQKSAVMRAFNEWADAEAVAAHFAYGLDLFCSDDMGKSNPEDSVLAPLNRGWLTSTYGVQFVTFDDLLARLARQLC